MAFVPVGAVSGMSLSKFLKIVSKGMVYNNLSTASPSWEFIKGQRTEDPQGRDHRFSVRTSLGLAAGQFIDVNGAQFPSAHRAALLEAVATYKNVASTIEVERTMIELAKADISKYGNPLAEEIEAKGIGLARALSGSFYRDGSGVIGTITSGSSAGVITLTTTSAARGGVGMIDIGDKVKIASVAGAAHDFGVAAGTVSYYLVTDKSRSADTVTVVAYTSADVALTINAAGTVVATDVIYRIGSVPQDLASIISTSELNAQSYDWAGIEALAGSSGTCHGLLYGGNLKGSSFDNSANPIDSNAFQQALSLGSLACGEGRYQWKRALLAHECYNAMLDASETDRRFVSGDNGSKGFKKLGYQDGSNFVEFVRDEFCPKQRVWILPEGKEVLEYLGTDIEPVKAQNGSEFHLKTGSGTHYDVVQMYMKGRGVLLCKHPAACISIKNFTVA